LKPLDLMLQTSASVGESSFPPAMPAEQIKKALKRALSTAPLSPFILATV
jgi:hypothetical protein